MFLVETDGTISRVIQGWLRKEMEWLGARGGAVVIRQGDNVRSGRPVEGRAIAARRAATLEWYRTRWQIPFKKSSARGAGSQGMSVTFKEMLSPTVTEYYPEEPARLEERYRGVHVLQRDSNGMEKCVACFLCAAACPANCIYIEAARIPRKCASPAANGTPRFTTSITTAASSAGIAWRRAPPTPSPTATDLKRPATTLPR